jgi:hypothetical protein
MSLRLRLRWFTGYLASFLANATVSGLASATDFLPPTFCPVSLALRSLAALSLETRAAFSNWLTAPSTCLMRSAVGVVSRKLSGLSAAMSVTEALEVAPSYLLDDEVSSEPVGSLNDDCPHPVASNALEHVPKALALVHRISTAHRSIIELLDHLIARSAGVAVDGLALSLGAVLVLPDVGR